MENKNPDFTFIIMILLFVVSLFLESPASLIVKMHAFILNVDPSSTMYFLGTTYEVIAFNYLVVFILIEFVILLLILTISFVLESGSEFEVNLPLALKKDSNYMFRKLSRINVNLNKNELRRLRHIKIIVIICLFILTVARFIGTHYWVSSNDTVTTMYFLFDYELTPLVYCPIVYFILKYIYYSLTQPLYAENIRNNINYKLAKEKKETGLREKVNKEEQKIIGYYTELIRLATNYLTSDYEFKQDEYEGYIADYLQRNPEYSSSINTLKERYATVRRSKQEVQEAKAEAETKRLLKLKQAQEARQEAQTFKKAEAECIAKVKTTNLKLSAFTKAIDKVNNADYLTEEVKSKYLLQLNRSKELYISYAENYASTYFRLHLAKVKKEINLICTNVYTHKHEIDGKELARIATNFEVLIKHPFNKLSNKHNTEITEISRLISDLTKLDKQEELEAELSGLLPVKDLKITQGKALEEALEKADLQSVETIDVILTELKANNSVFEKELSRLEAENDVLEQFGE